MIIEELLDKNIFDLLKGYKWTEEEKEQFIEEATQLILLSVVKRIEEEISPALKEEFIQLFTQDSTDEQRTQFLETHVPEFESIFLEEVLLFKDKALHMES